MFTRKFVGVVIGLLLIFCVLTANAFDHVRFAVISDPHVSLPAKGVVDGFKLGTKTVQLLQAAVDEINSVPDLDFVLVLGDLTQDAEPWNVDAVKMILDQLKVPYYVVFGNHDISPVPTEAKPDVIVGVSRWTLVSAFQGTRGGFYMDGRSYYAREVAPDLLLVALDTTWGPILWLGRTNFPRSN
jgi:Icc protein